MRRTVFPRLAFAAAAVTYLLIVMGGIVRVTGSGLGCGLKDDWPLCSGRLLPPLQANAVIEFTHRWIAAVATILVLALAIAAWTSQRRNRRVLVATTVAAALFIVQVALGALTVKYRLPGGIVLMHLANALLLLGVLSYIAVASRWAASSAPSRARGGRSTRLTTLAAGATYLLALSGALVVETGSSAGCAGWPLCGGGFRLPSSTQDAVNVAHRFVAGAVVLLILGIMVSVLRNERESGAIRRWAAGVCAVAALQVLAGALVVELRLPPAAQSVHLALAAALWTSVLIVAVLDRGASTVSSAERAESPHLERRATTPARVAS